MACNELGERHRAIMDWYLSIILIASDLNGDDEHVTCSFSFFFLI